MGYRDGETKKRRQKISETAANIFMMFCGFCGVYLLAAHMLYQEISVVSMLPYLIGGVIVAFFLPRVAEITAPDFPERREFHGREGAEAENAETERKRFSGKTNRVNAENSTGKKDIRAKAGENVQRRAVYDRETAERRWLAVLTLGVCLVFFVWNFKEILRGALVLADYIVFYYNYVFGTSAKFAVNLFSGEFVTVLGSRQSVYQLSEIQAGAIYMQPSLGANCGTLFGAIGFYSALFKTLYGCKWKTVLPDILFGGALLAAAFLVGAYETSWMGLCLLIFLMSLLLMFTQGGAVCIDGSEQRVKGSGRTGFQFGKKRNADTGNPGHGRKKNADTVKSEYGRKKTDGTVKSGYEKEENAKSEKVGFRKKKREERKRFRGGKTHILTVHNAKSTSFFAALVFLVAIALGASIFLIRKSSYFDSYDTPWIVGKWEQAGDFVKGITGGSGSISVETEGGTTGTDETETGEEEENTVAGENGETVVSWEPVTGEGEGNGITVEENLPSDDTVLGTLTLEDEMREASDTTYLKVLIDSSYYNSADTLYLKCYAGEIYEGDSWGAVTAEDLGVTETTFTAMNASLVVATYDLFSQYIRGTASDYLKTTLPGLFDIGASGKIRIQYMGDSSVLFVPYYAISSFGDGERGDRTLKSGDDTLTYAYNVDELLPDIAGADADTVIDYNAIAADFGDAFAYGDGLSISYDSTYAEYENMYLSDKIYLNVPESLSRLREEFSEVEIDGKTYELENYGLHYGLNFGNLAYEAGLGDCIGYVINYLTANMTYSRSIAAVPEGADYIETFLFDRKTGYCSHYASAAVMMFRMMGIPARYAEGFAVDLDDAVLTTGGQYLVNVTGKSAHAWVEIYVSGVGWVPVNVTYGDDTTQEEETSEAETTGDRETTAAEMTTTPRTSEEESTQAGGTGDGDADGQNLTVVFAELSELLRNIGQFLGKAFRALKTPLVVLILLELVRIFVRLARGARLRWKCRGKSEEEKLVICAEDLNRYIDRHLHIKKRRTMAQSEVAEAEGDLFARADGKAGEERKTGWNPFRYRTLESDRRGSGRKTGRRRGLADVIVRMGAQGGKSLSAAEYEELLGLIRYAGKKTDEAERVNLYLTMRKVKLVIYKESPWRRKIFF